MIDLIKSYVIGLLSLSLLGSSIYIYLLKGDLSSNAITLQDQRDQIGGFKKDLEDTGALMKIFSDSFEKLKVEQAKRESDVENAMAKVNEIAVAHAEYSAVILATTPKTTDLCKESDDLINSYITKEAKK